VAAHEILLRLLAAVYGTNCPFAAPQRLRLLSEELLPCGQRIRQANY
jgi:hypothetical protein